MDAISQHKGRITHAPEELYQIYQECNVPGVPVKLVLQRHGLRPWELSVLRKRAREAILSAFAGTPGRRKKNSVIPLSQHRAILQELEAAKDALAAVGHELALLKKRVNLV